jgi:hypothetical protein
VSPSRWLRGSIDECLRRDREEGAVQIGSDSVRETHRIAEQLESALVESLDEEAPSREHDSARTGVARRDEGGAEAGREQRRPPFGDAAPISPR